MALVGNKNDLYKEQIVSDREGKEYAKEINTIFKTVSAKTGNGVNDLFQSIGNKFFNPNWDIYKGSNDVRKIKKEVLHILTEYMNY